MPDYDVGPGIWEQMEAAGDKPIRNSDFINIEIGYGEKGRYVYQRLVDGQQFIDADLWESSGVNGEMVNVIGKLPATGEYHLRPLSAIRGITIHYTATQNTATVQSIAAGQLTRDAAPGQKFIAIAYHIVVSRDGTVYLCHELERKTWHASTGNRNETHVAICWIGGIPDGTPPTVEQIAGMKYAVAWVRQQVGRDLPIEGHRDIPNATECPGPTWPGWKSRIV